MPCNEGHVEFVGVSLQRSLLTVLKKVLRAQSIGRTLKKCLMPLCVSLRRMTALDMPSYSCLGAHHSCLFLNCLIELFESL